MGLCLRRAYACNFSTGLRPSTGIVPEHRPDDGTNKVTKTLDVWDTLARMVGPRPDTVTTDNLRSSRTESGVRPFNPGSPVDSNGAPLRAEVPQYKGDQSGPHGEYEVPFPLLPLSLPGFLIAAVCVCPVVVRLASTLNITPGIHAC